MLASVAKNAARAPAVASLRKTPARPFFSWYKKQWEGEDPLTHRDLISGREKIQHLAEEQGMVAFNRDPIFATPGSGTKENPIEVPSIYDERAVGYECPDAHQLMWFNMTKGPLHYIPAIDKHFKLVKAEDYEIKFD